MNLKRNDVLWIIFVASLIVITLSLIEYYRPPWAYPNDDRPGYISFECYDYNYTERNMEPMTVYPIFYNQSGFAVIDGHGGGLIRVFTDCIESYAVLDDNTTVWCNDTVEICEELYNSGR